MNKHCDSFQYFLENNPVFEHRKSTRAFLPGPVSDEQIRRILALASTAPSGGNMQPWNVDILKSATTKVLCQNIRDAAIERKTNPTDDYQYYPKEKVEPYAGRITQSNNDLYSALGLSRRDIAQKREEKLRNFDFFGAPIGLILTIDRELAKGSWIDMGIFIGYLLHAIGANGFDSCAQASFSSHGDIVRSVLGLASDRVVVCGIAIGKGDPNAAINNQPKRRMELEEFVRIHP